ncbi:MAG: glycogen debranching protein GlgX [Anaerolineae bacterium]
MNPTQLAAAQPGSPYPLGATVMPGGVNFSLFSAGATMVELLLFERYDQPPVQVIPLKPETNKTFYYWHIFVPGISAGQIYGYRVWGPYQPEHGQRFDGSKVLLDPYAKAVAYGANWSRADAIALGDNAASAMKSVVVNNDGYDWQGDRPLEHPMNMTVIYELHTRGYTAHHTSRVDSPGTFRGLQSKIPYLHKLGITAVELLPIHQFDEQEVQRRNPVNGEPLHNYWGYAPVAFFSPHLGYVSGGNANDAANELRDLVKALHQAGIEVILDIVFNHTAENDHNGPTISFRGLENQAYYMLCPDKRFYRNFSGTGNTVDCNHSIVRRLITDCLRYWVTEYHIDGFRFDLASVLSRNQDGEPMTDAPILWEIESDPLLAGTKLIAEAWDAMGLYQLGSFTGDRWAEWNGRFRDDVRRFIRGDDEAVRDFAWRMSGSFDIFRDKPSYTSYRSINYVTCHDGFTLADLVSYGSKHNEANGEGNRDGTDANYSWNCGIEGPSDDVRILELRQRQMRNLITLLLAARGTPMLLGGDELGRTQLGNNNAYCQDNEMSWVNWELADKNSDLQRFVREMLAFRLRHPTLTINHVLGSRSYEEMLVEGISYHGVELGKPDWGSHSHSLAIHFRGVTGDGDVYVLANAFQAELQFALPGDINWKRIVDTSLPSPQDFAHEDSAPLLQTESYQAAAHSVAVLYGTAR